MRHSELLCQKGIFFLCRLTDITSRTNVASLVVVGPLKQGMIGFVILRLRARNGLHVPSLGSTHSFKPSFKMTLHHFFVFPLWLYGVGAAIRQQSVGSPSRSRSVVAHPVPVEYYGHCRYFEGGGCHYKGHHQ